MSDEHTDRENESQTEPSDRPRGDDEVAVSVDSLFELLSQPGNRYVLSYLVHNENPVEYSDLVEEVVERAEIPEDTSKSEFRGRVAARLVHSNLPKLADSGLVNHHRDEQLVEATERIETVVPYLDLAMKHTEEGFTE